jgi:hypothetical protein
MHEVELKIVDGPDKPDLQWAVAYPDRHLHIHFRTEGDAVDAHIDRIEEFGDGTQLGLAGHLTSGLYKGWPFKAVYELGSRSGVIKARAPSQP